jgi:hypothetical protein
LLQNWFSRACVLLPIRAAQGELVAVGQVVALAPPAANRGVSFGAHSRLERSRERLGSGFGIAPNLPVGDLILNRNVQLLGSSHAAKREGQWERVAGADTRHNHVELV